MCHLEELQIYHLLTSIARDRHVLQKNLFKLAGRTPKGTLKTVTNAWNGYHGVSLKESDRHLTTFITLFGRFRYTKAPQVFVSSGVGYNRRFFYCLI